MKRLALIGIMCFSVFAPALAQSTPSPAPSVIPDAVGLRAQEMLHEFQTGKVDRSQLNTQMNAAMTADVLKQVQAKFSALGDPQQFTFSGKQTVQAGNTAYVYRVTFKSGGFNEIFVLDKDGKVSGFFLQPQQ